MDDIITQYHIQDENAEDNNNQEIHIQEEEKNVFISGDDNQIVGQENEQEQQGEGEGEEMAHEGEE